MTKEQAMAMLKAKRECIELDTNGNAELCDRNCGECKLNYEQGNMGEQKIVLDIAIKALEQQPSEDCVSRQAVLDEIKSMSNANPSYWNHCDVVDREDLIDSIKDLPSVTPTHGTCKDCENWNESEDIESLGICDELSSTRDNHYTTERFYCANFKKAR